MYLKKKDENEIIGTLSDKELWLMQQR